MWLPVYPMLVVSILVIALAVRSGADPQTQENVWKTSNGSRPWQNPTWATSSSLPGPSISATQRTPIQEHAEWPSLSGTHGTQQPRTSGSPLSYSGAVKPPVQSNPIAPGSFTTRQPFHHGHTQRNSLQAKPIFAGPTAMPSRVGPKATEQELKTLSEKLFDNDSSNTGKSIRINYQSRTQSNSRTDEASEPLLNIDADTLNKPTIKALRQLYDNYIADSSFVESVTAQERQEESEFLDKVLGTTVMIETMKFLVDKGFVNNGTKSQKELLNSIWFTQYTRGGGIIGSSAFEHVFLGELKRDEVSGLHNWIYFANEEGNHRVDYMGYLKKLDLGKESNLVKVHYRWLNVIKPSGSMFVGTSPELELALYTVCFLMYPDDRCPLSLGGKTFGIQTYTYRLNRNRGSVIGSAYPVF